MDLFNGVLSSTLVLYHKPDKILHSKDSVGGGTLKKKKKKKRKYFVCFPQAKICLH